MTGSRTTPHIIFTLLLTAPLSCTAQPQEDGAVADAQGCRSIIQPEPPRCGDGVVDPDAGEECDDGDWNDNTAACLDTCVAAQCGDGFVHAGAEDCDDGNTDDGDECPSNCLPLCGNGVLDGDEECDDGNTNDTDSCRNTCTHAACGDGVVQAGFEQCDDGNADDGDDCPTDCLLTPCGDGVADQAEECDDGNNDNTDSCLNTCVNAVCGDGFHREGAEECDDGNQDNSDDCTDACEAARCGDGFAHSELEECDDAGESMTCNTDCSVAECGDGLLNPTAGEECDDAGESMTCDADCSAAACGDGLLNTAAGEGCDDGNTEGGDGCSSECIVERLVFVTGTPYVASELGGLPGADARCNDHASAAGLDGAYMAWLSDDTGSPEFRFSKDSTASYILVNGDEIALGWEDLSDGELSAAIDLDENASPREGVDVWSNTLEHGSPKHTSAHCMNWTGTKPLESAGIGYSSATDHNWTDSYSLSCGSDLGAHLYCFQVSP